MQHILQHVHAAEEHEHARHQQHRPQRRQTLDAQGKDQRGAAPGPQRHRPVQRIEPQPLASQRRHDVVAEVVAQQRRFVVQIVGQIRRPIVVRQGEEHRAVARRVEAVRIEHAEGGENPAEQREQGQCDGGRPHRQPPGTAEHSPQASAQDDDGGNAEPPLEPSQQPDGHRQQQIDDGEAVDDGQRVAGCGAAVRSEQPPPPLANLVPRPASWARVALRGAARLQSTIGRAYGLFEGALTRRRGSTLRSARHARSHGGGAARSPLSCSRSGRLRSSASRTAAACGQPLGSAARSRAPARRRPSPRPAQRAGPSGPPRRSPCRRALPACLRSGHRR